MTNPTRIGSLLPEAVSDLASRRPDTAAAPDPPTRPAGACGSPGATWGEGADANRAAHIEGGGRCSR